jgi:adenylate cyclase
MAKAILKMTEELSEKDKKLKAHFEESIKRSDLSFEAKGRRVLRLLPSDPRCASCLAPFKGYGGRLVRVLLNKKPSTLNPLMCSSCEDFIRRLKIGVEVEMSMLFADIRGSTSLAESMEPMEFKQLITHFYSETTQVLMYSYAIIDKLVGDEVSGYYLPGIAGENFVRRSVEAAKELLRVTGHADPRGPWVPVGVGINTGMAYYGAVGTGDGMVELTALGDAVNVAARLGSHAAAGEILMSKSTVDKASLDTEDMEKRALELKGKSEPMEVWSLRIGAH